MDEVPTSAAALCQHGKVARKEHMAAKWKFKMQILVNNVDLCALQHIKKDWERSGRSNIVLQSSKVVFGFGPVITREQAAAHHEIGEICPV